MALKKWIASQLWQTFMNDYNENIDNLNGLLYANNAGTHNSIYRGKYLGSSVTEAQKTAISTGTFDDLYIGDYWTMNSVNYRIAAFNYYYNTGNTALTTNHITLVPDTIFPAKQMNDTATTAGGYVGSLMYTTNLADAKTAINTAFSGLVLEHQKYFSNAVNASGQASGGGWYDSTVDLMNEVMIFGSIISGKATSQENNIGTEKTQLPLFSLNPLSFNIRMSYWLRDVASATQFATTVTRGITGTTGANSVYVGVRPVFSIKGS